MNIINKWTTLRHRSGKIHVFPVKDLHEHYLSEYCSCHPKPDENCRNVIVHNSFDQRELKEKDYLQ